MKKNAFALVAASVLALSIQAALAQDKPASPPIWKQGQPESMKDSKLAPNPGKMTETAASEVPLDKLKLPKGFKAEVWATGMVGGRAMAFGDSGKKIYMGTRGIGRVYEVTDEGDKRTETQRNPFDKTHAADIVASRCAGVEISDRRFRCRLTASSRGRGRRLRPYGC